MENKKKCENCLAQLNIGVDSIRVDEGVIGVKDFVPLGGTMFFCCEKCLSDYFDTTDLPSMPTRLP